MKKIVVSLATLAALSSTVSADFLRVEVGGGMWSQEKNSGDVKVVESISGVEAVYNSKKETESGVYAWAYIKHFVPVIPNLRLEYSEISDSGVSSGKYFGQSVDNIPTDVDMKQLEFVPYYNILDNTFWITLDLGLDIKVIDLDYNARLSESKITADTPFGKYTADAPLDDYSSSISLPVPLGYARVRGQLPITGLAAEGSIKYLSVSDIGDVKEATISDFSIKVDYTFDITPLVQPGLEIGYRQVIVDVDYDDGDKSLFTDIDMSGLYFGAMLRF
jgi:outer membrane protein